MWYQVLIPGPLLLIPVLIITTKGNHQTPINGSDPKSDVIVTYSNHAEANAPQSILAITEKTTENIMVEYSTRGEKRRERKTTRRQESEPSDVEDPAQEQGQDEEDVVFIPNARNDDVIRNEVYLQREGVNIDDIMGGQKTVQDLLTAKDTRMETESPNTDIIFVMGKNNENIEATDKKSARKHNAPFEGHKSAETSTRPPKLKCKNLSCNNFIKSVCGEKLENEKLKYRLFLNDCYFRKVNCGFKQTINRYKKVPIEECKNIGAHTNPKSSFKQPSFDKKIKPVLVNNTRRASSSRRSMTMDIHGEFCSHPCPASCPEVYEPECVVSGTGRHRVFVNHCALDYNSCSFGVVWHRRPLSECVGGKKADMRQNAGFIGWMQRVGIVDKRGRLVLS